MKYKVPFLAICILFAYSVTGQTKTNNDQSTKTENKMDKNSVNASIEINAEPAKVWDVLTHPDKIVLYTGSTVKTDWEVGSTVTWSGEMNGMKYENKGKVLENTPNRLLRHTFWTGMGGDADRPENYSEVTYTLTPLDGNRVKLTYARTKIATEMEAQMFQEHVGSMLEEIKRLSEE